MLALALYLLGLSLPVFLFALICYVDDRKPSKMKATEPPRQRTPSNQELNPHVAGLEAQFQVAPATALRELLAELRSLGVPNGDDEGFESLLERLRKVERRRRALSA